MTLQKQNLTQRIEKAYDSAQNSHFLDEKGLKVIYERFIEECLDEDKKVTAKKFGSFIQWIHNEAFRNGLLHGISIIQEPYDR